MEVMTALARGRQGGRWRNLLSKVLGFVLTIRFRNADHTSTNIKEANKRARYIMNQRLTQFCVLKF